MTKWDEAWEAWDDVEIPKTESTVEEPSVEVKPKGKVAGFIGFAAIAIVILAIVHMSIDDSKKPPKPPKVAVNAGSTVLPVNRTGPVTLPEGTWRPPSYSEQKRRTPTRSNPTSPTSPAKSKQLRETLMATWKINLGPGYMGLEEKLIYHDGKMVLRRKYPDGSWGTQELIERPAKNSGERKFATEEGARSEYFTLSGGGRVKHFDWDGTQFAAAKATFVASNAMSIGSNAQARSCVPRRLSPCCNSVCPAPQRTSCLQGRFPIRPCRLCSGLSVQRLAEKGRVTGSVTTASSIGIHRGDGILPRGPLGTRMGLHDHG